MTTTDHGGPVGHGRRQVIAFALIAAGLTIIVAMNWLPDVFPVELAAPHTGYWVALLGGFAIAMTGAVLSLRASAAWRRQQRGGTR